jgi:hypothetical protein
MERNVSKGSECHNNNNNNNNVPYSTYKLHDSSANRKGTNKDRGIKLISKLLFHADGEYIFSQSVRMLGLIRALT